MLLFDAVKHAASNEPERVKTFYGQHQPLTTAVHELFSFTSIGDFERRVFHTSKKYHLQTPVGFEKTFRDYKSRWEGVVYEAIFPWLLDRLGIERNEEDIEHEVRDFKSTPERPDPEREENFDPLRHDGAKALEMAFWVTQSYADFADSDELADTTAYASKIGLEAYDYLTGTIGLDVEGVFRRWRNIPMIFLPAHVSNRHGLTERGSLYDLIDDAVRAYVFGAPAAAMAICRAALEMILKRHYDLDYQFRDKMGRLRDKGLGDLIILADEQYEFVQGKRLQNLADDANRIMHDYSGRERMSQEDETTILNFLKTIKFMAERAPAD